MNKKDWGYIIRVIKDYSKKNKSIVGQVLFLSLLGGIRPFISIILMGYLLDAVHAGAELKIMLFYSGVALGVSLLFKIIEGRLRENFNARNEFMVEQLNDLTNMKSLQLDYECLENVSLQELRRRLDRCGGSFGLLGMIFENVENFITNIISMIVAIMLVIPLFSQWNSSVGWIGSPLIAIGLLAVCGILIFVNYKKTVQCSIQEKKIREEAEHENNMQFYYMNHVLADYETQKDARIYHQQEIVHREISKMSEKVRIICKKLFHLDCGREYLSQGISSLTGVLVYLFAGLRAYVGMISIGSVVSYAATILRFTNSVGDLMSYMGYMQYVSQYCKDYVNYMDTPQRKLDGSTPIDKDKCTDLEVEFDHVSFKYPGTETYVMKDLCLKFTVGERMAIVGKNGSGKTTFIKLLCRLYDVTEGSIKLNGIDIREYDYKQYMDLFSVVFQDFQIFSFEVGENIAASDNVDEARAIDAMYKAGLKERFDSLPQGLHTYVGKEFEKSGVSFSGGEKQKMAIARAIYKGAPFVIMDEPTAALDPLSECEVYQGFDQMVGSKTAVYISHRLASCRFCQDILVFEQGNVIERGNHDELVQKNGTYSRLWNAQAQYYQL